MIKFRHLIGLYSPSYFFVTFSAVNPYAKLVYSGSVSSYPSRFLPPLPLGLPPIVDRACPFPITAWSLSHGRSLSGSLLAALGCLSLALREVQSVSPGSQVPWLCWHDWMQQAAVLLLD